MKNIPTESSSDKTVLRLVLVLSAFCALGMAIVYGVTVAENAKKADSFFAKAQDACGRQFLDTCLLRVNQALALREKPEYLRLKFNVLSSQAKTHEGKETLEQLIRLEPNNAHYYYLRSGLAKTTGNPALALESIEKAIALQPDNGDYQIAKATLLVEQDRRDEAIPIYEKLVAAQPHYYYYWNQYALSYSVYGLWEQALEIRQRGLAMNPKDYLQVFGLARLYDEMGQAAEAAAMYRRSLELHPLENSIAARRFFEITGKRVPPELENAVTDTMKIETRGNLTYVMADINGEKGRFLLDTGASISIIFNNKAPRYRLIPLSQVMTAETANGFVQAPLVYGHLRLGKHDIENVRFAVLKDLSNKAVDGIIGMDVLGLFRFEIDRGQGLLTLRSQ